jgi:hypothetical protein
MLLKQALQNAWSLSQSINCEEGNKVRVHKQHSFPTASPATEEAVYGGVKKERQSEKGTR